MRWFPGSFAAGAVAAAAAWTPTEPDLAEYFGFAPGEGAAEPERYTDISTDKFNQLVLKGIPFVVSDGGKGLPMSTWNCEYLQKTFSGVRFRQEYGNGEVNKELLGSDWLNTKVPIKGRKLPPGAPKYAPFYSDLVKAWRSEAERKWGDKSQVVKMEKAIQKATKAPYFMERSNEDEMKRNPEFWLQPPETGSMAHMDEHCISTIATTLSGLKRWRLASIPKNPHPEGYFDGLVYERDEWDPIFNFTLGPGEALIFPPGMIHEGVSVGDECVASITYQFNVPAPVEYFRTFFPRLRRTADMQNCVQQVAVWASLGENRKFKPKAHSGASKHARELLKTIDGDGNGELSLNEIQARLRSEEDALNAFRYHDSNGDGRVTADEFVDNFAAWSAVERQAIKDGVKFEL